jgi:hypothetical protein
MQIRLKNLFQRNPPGFIVRVPDGNHATRIANKHRGFGDFGLDRFLYLEKPTGVGEVFRASLRRSAGSHKRAAMGWLAVLCCCSSWWRVALKQP